MNTNDHRGAKGGLRRLRRPRLLTCAAALAVVAAVPSPRARRGKPSLAAPNGLQTFQLRLTATTA